MDHLGVSTLRSQVKRCVLGWVIVSNMQIRQQQCCFWPWIITLLNISGTLTFAWWSSSNCTTSTLPPSHLQKAYVIRPLCYCPKYPFLDFSRRTHVGFMDWLLGAHFWGQECWHISSKMFSREMKSSAVVVEPLMNVRPSFKKGLKEVQLPVSCCCVEGHSWRPAWELWIKQNSSLYSLNIQASRPIRSCQPALRMFIF
jgi:hypothetical protein